MFQKHRVHVEKTHQAVDETREAIENIWTDLEEFNRWRLFVEDHIRMDQAHGSYQNYNSNYKAGKKGRRGNS